ncbi:hypothetical protein M2105_002022 [Paenibacillus sp. PastF-1]|nr:hypothetical protein [Paenibacillus sp. PastF-2]MDF9847596.1 hypothetical protein [Paenibacillus sp. PastM-2]MDF9854165.1 hypothetical protein [Paenibacillus sp. PastF-1]MDH6479663.1 hypothetical protein [Paenibacillus sp. PastH-2]MDH6505328.1 hypothetical protein [Paenibacillus sp. PastM-3]
MVYEFDSEIKMLEGKMKWKVMRSFCRNILQKAL